MSLWKSLKSEKCSALITQRQIVGKTCIIFSVFFWRAFVVGVLVTGATGFIASHCIRLLLEEGYTVRGTVRNLKDAKRVAPLYQLSPKAKDRLELVEADLLDSSSWTE